MLQAELDALLNQLAQKELDLETLHAEINTFFKSVMPRDERGRWVRLPRTPARQLQARNRLISANNKAPDLY